MADPVRRQLPNLLTIARVVLSVLFFAIVAITLWPQGVVDIADRQFWGNVAVVIFIVAAATDFADGWLARRWKVVSMFGRVMDPFGDKLLVIGTFVLLASPAFLDVTTLPGGEIAISQGPGDPATMSTGVRPWMVLVILGRELLVTSIRGMIEGMGLQFAAGWSGKWKMVLQSIAAPLALFVAVNPFALDSSGWTTVRDVVVWATVLVTAWSAIPYVIRARRLVDGSDRGASA